MIQTNLRNVIHLKGTQGPILMLHGFPSEPTNDLNSEKNFDLGVKLNKKGYDVYLYHYEGLGKNRDGNFTFSSSIKESIALTRDLLKTHKHISIIGHSWGGYIALILNQLFGDEISKTILMSPFCFIPENEILDKVIIDLCSQVPYILKDGMTDNELSKDLRSADVCFFSNKNEIIKKFKNTHIYHPSSDEEIPLSSSQMIQEINPSIRINICDTDHGFRINREEIFEKISGDHF